MAKNLLQPVRNTVDSLTPQLNEHLELVPATFLYSLYLTVYRTDISPSQTLSVFPKVSVLERVVSTTVVLELLVRSLLIGRRKQWRVILSIVSVLFGVRETHHNFSSDIYYPDL